MAVYSTQAKSGPYLADGVRTVFPYGFYALEPAHVAVIVDTVQQRSGFDVSVGANGGDVVFAVPPPNGSQVFIVRNVPFTQETDIQNNTAFYPEILEAAYDKLTMMVQQLKETAADLVQYVNDNAGTTVIIGGDSVVGGGSYVANTAYQFAVIDSSSYTEAGVLLSKKVSVVNGRSWGATLCGTLNGVEYARTELPLTEGVAKFYIYASGGTCYALNHRIASNVVPTLLLATVTFAADGRPIIHQESFVDNPVIPVVEREAGNVVLSATAQYSNHVLRYSYAVSVKALCNNTPISFSGSIPPAAEGSLVAYVEKLTLSNGETPSVGLCFTAESGNPAGGAEWTLPVLSYSLEEDSTEKRFRVNGIVRDPYLITFTELDLGDSE